VNQSIVANQTSTVEWSVHPALVSHELAAYSERVRYGFTTRPLPTGGVQLEEADREANRQQWCHRFGFKPGHSLLVPTQCHGDRFLWASQCCALADQAASLEADGVILDEPGPIGLVQVADCLPLVLYAPDVHKAALVHAGWRGTALGIAAKAVAHLQALGADPAEMIAVIGPGLSPIGFEVGPEVVTALAASLPLSVNPSDWSKVGPQGKPHVDLKRVNNLQLQAMGVATVDTLSLCTDTDRQWLWSHRGGDWERQGVMVQLL
jgi:polyphenol oxidase